MRPLEPTVATHGRLIEKYGYGATRTGARDVEGRMIARELAGRHSLMFSYGKRASDAAGRLTRAIVLPFASAVRRQPAFE